MAKYVFSTFMQNKYNPPRPPLASKRHGHISEQIVSVQQPFSLIALAIFYESTLCRTWRRLLAEQFEKMVVIHPNGLHSLGRQGPTIFPHHCDSSHPLLPVPWSETTDRIYHQVRRNLVICSCIPFLWRMAIDNKRKPNHLGHRTDLTSAVDGMRRVYVD